MGPLSAVAGGADVKWLPQNSRDGSRLYGITEAGGETVSLLLLVKGKAAGDTATVSPQMVFR